MRIIVIVYALILVILGITGLVLELTNNEHNVVDLWKGLSIN